MVYLYRYPYVLGGGCAVVDLVLMLVSEPSEESLVLQKSFINILRGGLLAGAALLALAPASRATTLISYTTTITPDSSSAGYAGVASLFYLPYTASNSNVTINTTPVQTNVGSFITDPFSVGHTPAVVSTGIEFSITPTIGATTFSTLNFFADITNPATNVYCLNFATTSAGPFNSSTNCATSNPNTLVSEKFDSNLFQVELPTFLDINSLAKTTNLPLTFATVATPEPASMALVGLVLAGFGGLAIRRRVRDAAKA
jgi:PEP-CTERM motif